MKFDQQMRQNILAGFLEVQIYNGESPHNVGKNAGLLFEAMEASHISSVCGSKDEKDAHCGNYDKGLK